MFSMNENLPFTERSIQFGRHILLPKPDPRLPPDKQYSEFLAYKTTAALHNWKNFPTYEDAINARTSLPVPANKFPDQFLKLEGARLENIFVAVASPCQNRLSIQYLNPKKFAQKVIAIARTYKTSSTLFTIETEQNNHTRYLPFVEILDADNHQLPISIEFILTEGITVGFRFLT